MTTHADTVIGLTGQLHILLAQSDESAAMVRKALGPRATVKWQKRHLLLRCSLWSNLNQLGLALAAPASQELSPSLRSSAERLHAHGCKVFDKRFPFDRPMEISSACHHAWETLQDGSTICFECDAPRN